MNQPDDGAIPALIFVLVMILVVGIIVVLAAMVWSWATS